MANRLRNYFPLIRERKEVLKEIGENSGLYAVFTGWKPEQQEPTEQEPTEQETAQQKVPERKPV